MHLTLSKCLRWQHFKNVKSTRKEVDLANLTKNLTKPEEEVAVTEFATKCHEMSTF